MKLLGPSKLMALAKPMVDKWMSEKECWMDGWIDESHLRAIQLVLAVPLDLQVVVRLHSLVMGSSE